MSTLTSSRRVVVAGFGSEYRLDDGVGPLVAARVESADARALDVGPLSDPLDLLGHWNGAELAVIIDAVRSGVAPGTVRVVEMNVDASSDSDARAGELVASGTTSTHGIGLEGVLRLARAIGQAPKRLVVVGIEGERFGVGEGLSPAVQAAIPEAVRCVVALIKEV